MFLFSRFNYVWFLIALLVEICKIVVCVTEARWSEWSDWTSCSVSCGLGKQSRYRNCDLGLSRKSIFCEGSYIDKRECDTFIKCPVDGGWSEWSEWTMCSVSCGEGTMHRYRSCDSPLPQSGGRPCEGERQESQPCFAIKDCPRDGKWSSWSEWSSCSVTCGRGGSIHRYRSCNNPPPAADGRPCNGLSHSEMPCEAPIRCPVNGQWSEWSEWTECSVTCGKGEKRRLRTCDQPPPQYGGNDCNRAEAAEMQLWMCNGRLLHCPVDGGWSEWGEWGPCYNPDCDSSSQNSYAMRERQCNAPLPAHNGSMCQGTFLQAGLCQRPTNCKVDGGWSEWSEWICEKEVVRRNRKCDNPTPSFGGKPCKGSGVEFYEENEEEYAELCPDFVPEEFEKSVQEEEEEEESAGNGVHIEEDEAV